MDVAEIAAVLGLSVKEEDWDHALELIDKVKKSTEEVGHVGKKAGEEAAEGWAKLKEMAELTEHFLEEYIGYEGIKSIGEMTEKVVSQTMQLQHLSERYGVTVETLQNFDYMAKLTGTSLQSVTNAMQRMEFGLRATSKSAGIRGAAGALQKLGISATEFKKADMNGQLGMLADKFEKMADPNQKIAMAMQLGGRGMVSLIPLLSQGRDKMHELSQEAQELGYNLDPKQAAEYEEQQAKLQLQWDGLKTHIVELLLPALKQLGEYLSRIMTYFREHPEQLHRLLMLIGAVAAFTAIAMTTLAFKTLFANEAFTTLIGTLGPVLAIILATVEAFKWANENLGKTPAVLIAVAGAVTALAVALRGLKTEGGIAGGLLGVGKKLLGLGGGSAGLAAGSAAEGASAVAEAAEGAAAEGAKIGAAQVGEVLAPLLAPLAPFALGLAGVAAGAYALGPNLGTPTKANSFAGFDFGSDKESMQRFLTNDERDELKKTQGGRDFLGQIGDVHINAPVQIITETSAEDIKAAIDGHIGDQLRDAKKNIEEE